jgi:putative MFS transporter
MFFKSSNLLKRYLLCFILGSPIWIFIGIFITLSPEIAKELQITDPVSAGRAILFYNIGFGIGDLGSSYLSQLLQSRKKSAAIFMCFALAAVILFLNPLQLTSFYLYGICILLGMGGGYWAVFLMISAEQFGTNMRATVATSLPNMVRVMVVPVSICIQYYKASVGLVSILWWVGLGFIAVAALALSKMKETYAADLEFVER